MILSFDLVHKKVRNQDKVQSFVSVEIDYQLTIQRSIRSEWFFLEIDRGVSDSNNFPILLVDVINYVWVMASQDELHSLTVHLQILSDVVDAIYTKTVFKFVYKHNCPVWPKRHAA